MYKKQIVVIVIVVAIMGYLYTQPVKGLAKHAGSEGHQDKPVSQSGRPAVNVNVDMVSAAAKIAIGQALANQINDLEGQLKKADDNAAKLALQKQLAKHWDDVNQPAPAAFYYEAVARERKIPLKTGLQPVRVLTMHTN